MSFDVNIGSAKPVIKAAANTNNDGGSGGNLGYMMSGGGQNKKENQGSLFANQKPDSFELSSKLPNDDLKGMPEANGWFNKLLKKLGA